MRLRWSCTHTLVAVLCGAGSVAAAIGAPSTPDTVLLVGADAATLEEMLADADGAHELALRLRLRQRSAGLDELAFYRRAQWTSPSGAQFLHVVTERDAGEPDWHDYVGIHGNWRLSPTVEAHFGDLRPGFAQGLVFSRGGRRGSSTVSPAMRSDSDLLGYRASGENQSLRGAGVRLRRRRLEVALLAGAVRRDARFDTTGTVTSMPDGGRHVTATERAGKDQLAGTVAGLRLRHTTAPVTIGLTLQSFSAAARIDLRRPETRPFAFAGRGQRLLAADVTAANGGRRTRAAFLEIAVDGRSEWAWVAGGRVTAGGTRLDVLGRYYSIGFHSFFGGAASAVGMQNELGLSLAARGRGGRRLRWRLFGDRYQRPGSEMTAAATGDSPVGAHVWGGVVRAALNERWQLETTLQQRRRWRSLGRPHDAHSTIRVDAIWSDASRASRTFRLRAERRRVRVESDAAQQGLNASLSWRHERAAYAYVIHLSRFATESWAARVYEYERDFPGAVSIRALYGDGWRAYALVQRTWRRQLSVAVRCRHERIPERRRATTSAGLQIDYGAN